LPCPTHRRTTSTTRKPALWNSILASAATSQTDLHAGLGWLHDYSAGVWDTAGFVAFPGATFIVSGAAPPADAAHLVVGIQHDTDNVSLTLNTESVVSATSRSFGGTASVSVHW
jgi:uncharacterized protein with beta-barrel porin domain